MARGWLAARRGLIRVALGVTWLTAVALELPYQVSPAPVTPGRAKLYIIGDSVAAGVSDRESGTWPRLLAERAGIDVVDLSRMGATAASALRQTGHLPADGGVVLLEIGGNDLLGSTTAARFEHDLEQLLARVCGADREVLMFELPLPPLRNEYGRVQRRLAARYGVRLVPKRVFAAVLTGDGATLDSVHLSQAGHRRMAEVVCDLLGMPPPADVAGAT